MTSDTSGAYVKYELSNFCQFLVQLIPPLVLPGPFSVYLVDANGHAPLRSCAIPRTFLVRLRQKIRPTPLRGELCTTYQWHLGAVFMVWVVTQHMGATSAPSHHYWCGAVRYSNTFQVVKPVYTLSCFTCLETCILVGLVLHRHGMSDVFACYGFGTNIHGLLSRWI